MSNRYTTSINSALSNFDQLPDSANVRLPTVMGLYGISAATVWRQVKAGIIPSPRKLTPRTTAWSVKDLRGVLNREVKNG
ncbi:AlpA Predicted transcriptional regulator [Candidatus Methylopumilus universalis]|uniref:helix-turn-helix transcriptional regulator n=1 Tax=Candidatus Methylopumilus universalis TaxID=2588536 RepID=UPI003BEEB89F